MAIKIYTYGDPYKIDEEFYWEEICKCPYFCVSQTLVNGLRAVYKNHYSHGRTTTIQNLVDEIFAEWVSTKAVVKQHTAIDNLIDSGIPAVLQPAMQDNIEKAFLFNRDEVFNSLRTMFELNLNVSKILLDKLTPEQKFIVELYKQIINSNKIKDFELSTDFDESYIDDSIIRAIAKNSKDGIDAELDLSRIVIHGIHQFTPLVLRLIELLSQYKEVILLFNYQSQYKNIYQTWIDIYSAFDQSITITNGVEFKPNMLIASYEGNLLADNLGKLVEGDVRHISSEHSYEIIEFDNLTEFANYVADLYIEAQNINPDNPLYCMREHIYSADNTINDILKTYFPEQFGERQFLNYPLGHFILSLANMWEPQSDQIVVKDLNDVKECLSAGVLKESYIGELSTIFNKINVLFEGCVSIDEMKTRIKRLRKNKKRITDSRKKEYLSHISYYSVSDEELSKLLVAFEDLEKLSVYFYEDFNNKAHNFKEFYEKLKQYLKKEILMSEGLNAEFADIVRRVLERLEEVDQIDTSASFECLKSTMSIYLLQETKPGKSANWIVRGFEQIDGDILRSKYEENDSKTVYHFACLTDEDIASSGKNEFPWPLNAEFFEVAQNPVDWKYQVYVKARKEFKNFKRYALIYGLEFNRSNFKLSFVKRNGEKSREPYYLLKLLGVKKKLYGVFKTESSKNGRIDVNSNGSLENNFSEYDVYRYKICRYRFLLESIVEKTTIYKDNFLLLKFFEVLVENQTREELQGLPISEVLLNSRLEEVYDDLKKYFPFERNVNRMDIISNIRSRLLNVQNDYFPQLTDEDRQYMMIRELFIHKQLSDRKTFRKNILSEKFIKVSEDVVKQLLSKEKLESLSYRKSVDVWCQYCSNREICMDYYAKVDS